MTWFTENSWPGMLLAACVASLLIAWWFRTRRLLGLAGAGVCLMLIPILYLVDQRIITPREQVQQAVYEITRAMQAGDVKRSVGFISEQAPQLRYLMTAVLRAIDVHDDMRVTDIRIEMTGRGTRAVARFRVNTTVSLVQSDYREFQPTRWETTWQLEQGDWRLVKVQELDPFTGRYLNRLGNPFLGQESRESD